MDKKQIIEDYLQGRHPMEQHSWELPSAQELERDEALFESLVPQKKAPKRIRLWPLAVAACVAGFVAIFLAPPREANVEPEKQPVVAEQKEKQEETIASSQEPRVESQQPIASSQEPRVEKQQTTVKAEQLTASSQQPRVESQRPTANSQQPKLKSQQPIEESMLAEAEINSSHLGEVGRGALPEMEDPFLAIAQQIQDIRSRGEQVRQEVAQLIDKQYNLQ
ncbi:MAG: hypothetical protein J6W21_04975 [Bacteroidaceae bacterium]|nr:hypothetical protein [Bacteroidaceae bacterium]